MLPYFLSLGSHAPAWKFIRQHSSVTGGIPTPELGNDRVVIIFLWLCQIDYTL
jgi:hypothetical protein